MLRYTLVADGTSDRALLPIIDWLIEQHWDQPYQSQLAEHLPPLRSGLRHRIEVAYALYPCDVLFVHRDAESATLARRTAEIARAIPDEVAIHVCVVPVRMMEAWLLSDHDAIREAADNPAGRSALALPNWRRWETLADPKVALREALQRASELSGRKLRKFHPDSRRSRVAELTTDFSQLRALNAFQVLEADVIATCAALS